VYYRLADGNDPVIATVREAVSHALGHVDAIRRDADRLHKKTGCCLPASAAAPSFSCCAPASRLASDPLLDDAAQP
jgi:hypothetical protein